MQRRSSVEHNQQQASTSDTSTSKKMSKLQSNIELTNCPICFEIISEAYITACGHTFCFKCIQKSIDINKTCPKCSSKCEQIFPNFLLNELISKQLLEQQEKERMFSIPQSVDEDPADNLKTFLASESKKLSLPEINVILDIFTQRKILLEAESISAQNRLLLEFLQHLLKTTENEKRELNKKIRLIRKDIRVVEDILKNVQNTCPKIEDVEKHFEKSTDPSTSSTETSTQLNAIRDEMKQLISDIDSSMPENVEKNLVESAIEEQQTSSAAALSQSSTYKVRKQRMFQHFEDFMACYYTNRAEDLHFQHSEEEELMIMDTNEQAESNVMKNASLDVFRENLVKFSKYSQLRTLSSLNYSNETTVMPSTIVSSIEFDKDSEFFAIAGVTKRIKIFDYYACIRDAVVDIKHPITEMVCSSKISCVSYNSYFKELLASSDYEGIVTIYDVETKARKRTFSEHDKRCWSVDFNEIDAKLLASGSDDARVKLWSIDCENSVATLDVKTANVCCVKFNPKSSCHLAFGTASHCIEYYDLRNLKYPLSILKGHRKAVSYVKFLNSEQIISAGTDGQLKLWDINKQPHCIRSFVGGHINEKNFVGLATNGDYIACGSEDNSLCIYYKGLSKKLFNLKFDLQQGHRYSGYEFDNKIQSSDNNEFVSAVCWKKAPSSSQQSNIILAGNSRGIIKILELV